MAQVLVIDDNEQITGLFKTWLERAGYDVQVAGNGKEALRIFREQPADIVITDIFMPEKDGIETMMELWRDFPDIPVIAISGGSAHSSADMSLEYAQVFGALHTLFKPVERNNLLEVVESALA